MMKPLKLCLVLGVCMVGSTVFGEPAKQAPPEVVRLWETKAPLAKGDTDKDKPTLTLFLAPADKANGTGVVLCPGGGYQGLAVKHEGAEIAEFFNNLGVSVFMLKYRLASSGYQHPAPLLDVQRAIRTVRANAKKWNVDPSRVGVMGFSAGGHLASTVGTHFDTGKKDVAELVEQMSCRPDFMILGYPVIMFGSEYTHKGSEDGLLGKNPEPALLESLANEKQVTKDTPPTFLFHTDADKVVKPENSVMFYLALRKHNVPAELHIYQDGKHGVGLGLNIPGTNTWSECLTNWLHVRGLLPSEKPAG